MRVADCGFPVEIADINAGIVPSFLKLFVEDDVRELIGELIDVLDAHGVARQIFGVGADRNVIRRNLAEIHKSSPDRNGARLLSVLSPNIARLDHIDGLWEPWVRTIRASDFGGRRGA